MHSDLLNNNHSLKTPDTPHDPLSAPPHTAPAPVDSPPLRPLHTIMLDAIPPQDPYAPSPDNPRSAVRALLIVDMQNDFCPGGSLAVTSGDEVVPVINAVRKRVRFDHVFLTKDWHPADHVSFAVNHAGRKEFEAVDVDGLNQVLWPVHCVQGSKGAEMVDGLHVEEGDVVVCKGTHYLYDSYSGFWDNAKLHRTALEKELRARGVTDLYICGLAIDYCVGWTALHAVEAGFRSFLLIDATRGIDEDGVKEMTRRLENAGVILTSTLKLSF